MNDQTSEQTHEEHLEDYGDPGILSKDAPIPRWLIWTYLILPIWGVFTWFYFWNGTHGWLDRGYWHQLQQAAGTTFPVENIYNVEVQTLEKARQAQQEN